MMRNGVDRTLACLLLMVLLPLMIGIALVILVKDGRPVLYRSERMKTPKDAFFLWKFRTMRPEQVDSGVSGGDKADRITWSGHWLRRYRLDELPQLWNILRGDIGFVGPRPPLRRYVTLCPETYEAVLQVRPGVTGLASVVFHAHEEMLLAPCKTKAQTEEVYVARCIPRKALLDLIHARHRNFLFDFRIMLATIWPKIGWTRRR